MPFRALGLGPRILKSIQDAGYTEPTPIQIKAIPVILKGKDVIGTAQTGTGKTAAYVLPILERLAAREPSARKASRVLVLVPTRELAVQVEDSVKTYGRHLPIRCASVYGGVGEVPQIKALRAGVEIVIATPGRLLDLMNSMPHSFKELDTLVLDEADRMLDMGFLPDIRRIVRPLPKARQTLLFSATFSDEIEKVSREFLQHPERVEVGRRAEPTHTVAQFVYEISPTKKIPLLLHLLRDEKLDMVLVFTRTKRGADKLAKRLEQGAITTTTLHSNKSQSQRQAALKGFKSGRFRVLVATDIAARGIDVDGISHVVNYDFPGQNEDYVHRIGRTGRALAIGDALSFVTPEEHGDLRSLERFIGRGIPRRTVDHLPDAPAPVVQHEPRREQVHAPRGGRSQPARRGGAQQPRGGGGGGRPQSQRGSAPHSSRGSNFSSGGRSGESSSARRGGDSPPRRGGDQAPRRSGNSAPRRSGGGQAPHRPGERAPRRGDGSVVSRGTSPRGPRHETARQEAPEASTIWGRIGRAIRRKPGQGR